MYETSDMGLCAALVSLGERMESKELEGGRIVFTFQDSSRIQYLAEEYFRDTLMVKAKTFNDEIRSIKGQIIQLNRNRY